MTTNTSTGTTSLVGRRALASRVLVLALASATLALAGCAVDTDADQAPADLTVIEQAAEIIAEIETDDGVKLTFTLEAAGVDGGHPVVAVTEQAPIDAPSYVERLRHMGATSLESFLALAPEGAEAPAALRIAHEHEAMGLGRSTEVRTIDGTTMLAEPPSTSSTCNSYQAFEDSVSDWTSVQISDSVQSHSLTFDPGAGAVVLGAMCNYRSNRVDYKYAQFCHEVRFPGMPPNIPGYLYCDARIIVPDGQRVFRTWFDADTKRMVRADVLENYTLAVSSFIAIGGTPATL